MSSPTDLPPNPREAKYRSAPLHWSFYPVTVALIAACFIVAALSGIGKDNRRVESLFFGDPLTRSEEQVLWIQVHLDYQRQHGPLPELASPEIEAALQEEFDRRVKRGSFAKISEGQMWRLFSPMFLHFGPMHLIFNLMALWDLGRVLESRFRRLRFLLLVLGTSVAANVAQALYSGPGFGGMSGVIYGLFGFVLLRQKFHPAGDVRLNPQTVPFMLIWLVICFTGAVGPVANAAHVAGLVAGGAIGWVNAMLGGGWDVMKRRRRFQAALAQSDSALHRCTVCRRTEQDDVDLDFRIGPDGEEYCTAHLPKV